MNPRFRPPILTFGLICLLLTLALALGSGCSEVAPTPSSPQDGRWWAAIDIGDSELPFYLEFETGEEGQQAWLLSGEQRVPLNTLSTDPILTLEFEHYDSRFEGVLDDDGRRLEGRWRLTLGDRKIEFPFVAEAGGRPLFGTSQNASDPTPLPDRWDVRIAGMDAPLVAVLHSHESSVVGNFLQVSGDYPTVVGNLTDGKLQLAHFEGARALLIEAELQVDGRLQGRIVDPVFMQEYQWSAEPNPDATLPDAFEQVEVAEGFDLDTLVVYDLEGNELSVAELHTPGRPLLIEILGTWCPTCHEAAAFLMQLHDDYAVHDLEILGIAFEMSSNFDYNVSRLKRYRARHGIEYPIVLASNHGGRSPSELIDTARGRYAFPTVLFVDGQGRVRKSYAGFRGAEHTLEHEQMKTQWRASIEELLVER